MRIVHADIKPDNFLLCHTPSSSRWFDTSNLAQFLVYLSWIGVSKFGHHSWLLLFRPEPSLQLIDFGKAIDLELENPEGQAQSSEGRQVFTSEYFSCSSFISQQGKYHLDYFGIAGSAYCLLFGKYIEVSLVFEFFVTSFLLWTWKFNRWAPWKISGWWKTTSSDGGKSRYNNILSTSWLIFLSQLWTQFFDDMLNPKTEEKQFLPSLLKWRARLLGLFDEVAINDSFNFWQQWFLAERGTENWSDQSQRDNRHEVHGEVAKMLPVKQHYQGGQSFSLPPHLPSNEWVCPCDDSHIDGLLGSSVFLSLSTLSKIFISRCDLRHSIRKCVLVLNETRLWWIATMQSWQHCQQRSVPIV